MNSCEVESFLARLYTDAELLARYVRDPLAEMRTENLSALTIGAMLKMDLQELQLAALSYHHKRQSSKKPFGFLARIKNRWC